MENSTFCLTGLLQADSEAGETATTSGGRKRGSRRPEVWLPAEPPVSILRGGRGKVPAGRDAPDKCQGLVTARGVLPRDQTAFLWTAGRKALACSPHPILCLLSELHSGRGRGNLRSCLTTCFLALLLLHPASSHPRPHCSLPGSRLRPSPFLRRLHLGGPPKQREAEEELHHLPALVLPLQLLCMQGQREPPGDLQLPRGAAGRGQGGQLPPRRHG